jgi:hypothetical protein
MMLSSLRIVASTIALWMLLCSVAPPGSTSATAVTAREEPSGSSLAGAAADTAAARAAGALVMMWRLIAGASPLSSSWWSLAKDQKRGNVPLLHLKDPGVAEEDLEDYEFYVYEQQQREEIEVKAATTKKETALPAVDTPSTLTCLEEGTCVLRVDEVSLVPNAEDDDRCDSQESSPEPHRASSPGNAAAAADGVIIEEESGASNVEADDDDDDASESPTTQDIVPADGDDSNGEQSVEVSETGADMGEPQEIPGGSGGLAVRDRIIQARQYMQDKVSDPNNSKYDKVRALCSNKHPSCAFWATLGECKANPAYMLVRLIFALPPPRPALLPQDPSSRWLLGLKTAPLFFPLSSILVRSAQINCAPVCESCEQIHIDTRCPMDAGDTSNDAWRKPGDLNSMFERIVSDPTLQTYQPLVLSRPSYAPGDVPENATYKLGLWMVQFENAISPEEADRLLELGMNEGYERSSDVGEEKPDGTFEAYVNDKRTSTNSVGFFRSFSSLLPTALPVGPLPTSGRDRSSALAAESFITALFSFTPFL